MYINFRYSTAFLGFFLRKLPLFLFFIPVFCAQLYTQTARKTNLEIFEQEISGELDKFFFYPQINRDVKFVFFVSSAKNYKEEKKFIELVIRKNAERNKLKIAFAKDEKMDAPDSIYIKCRITVEKLKTEYTKLIKNGFLGQKSMQREIVSELDLDISDNFATILVKDMIRTKYDDEIPYEDFEVFQSSEYIFTQSIPPNISFIESIIFPAAIITLSAVATILFFIIRSK